MNILSKITNHSSFSKGIIFLDQALVSGSNFLVGILLVRWLGLESYGFFVLLWMSVLFALGSNQAFITKPLLSIAPKLIGEKRKEYLGNLHAVQVFVSVLLFLLGLTIYVFSDLFFEEAVFVFLPVLSLIVFGQTMHDFYRKIYLVKNNIRKVLLIDVIFYGGQIIGVILLILIHELSLASFLNLTLLVNAISVLVGMFKLEFSTSSIKNILVRHFHFSKWLLGTSVLQWLSGNYFIIVGASILGTSAVGAIRMVQNVMGLCHILFLAMENIIPIEAAQRFQAEGENGLTQYLLSMTKKIGTGFCIVLIGIALFSSSILALFYGEEAVQFSFIVFDFYSICFGDHF